MLKGLCVQNNIIGFIFLTMQAFILFYVFSRGLFIYSSILSRVLGRQGLILFWLQVLKSGWPGLPDNSCSHETFCYTLSRGASKLLLSVKTDFNLPPEFCVLLNLVLLLKLKIKIFTSMLDYLEISLNIFFKSKLKQSLPQTQAR